MIKKLLLTLSLFVNLSFGNSETISLTGDFAKNDLGNPFRALLEKKINQSQYLVKTKMFL